MERRSFIESFVWGAGGALVMILFLLFYGTFGHYFTDRPAFDHSTLSIQRASGPPVSLNVELAISSRQKSYGLMYIRALPKNAGMLFLWGADQPVSFWMKNTFIPLDMLFIRYDGVIVRIATHTEPFSLTGIPSGEPVRGVLEINGGTVDRLGIHTGDKVLFQAFAASH